MQQHAFPGSSARVHVWPRSARITTWALAVLIGLTGIGAATGDRGREKLPAAVLAIPSTTTTELDRATSTPSTSAPTTTTTSRPVTTTEAPTTTAAPVPVVEPPAPTTPDPTWPPEVTPVAPPAAPAGGYANCAAARAAGAAPVHIGEPGYASRLDGDGDGVGCE